MVGKHSFIGLLFCSVPSFPVRSLIQNAVCRNMETPNHVSFDAMTAASRASTNAPTRAPSCSLSLVPDARRYSTSARRSTSSTLTRTGSVMRNRRLHGGQRRCIRMVRWCIQDNKRCEMVIPFHTSHTALFSRGHGPSQKDNPLNECCGLIDSLQAENSRRVGVECCGRHVI